MRVFGVAAVCVSAVSAAEPQIRVSRQTTYVTQPVRKDGTVDYVDAFNKRFSKGVTAKNNAAVPLWRAFGPGEIPKRQRGAFCSRIGIKELPESGPYFVPLLASTTSLKGRKKEEAEDALIQDFEAASDEPWKAFQYPDIAKWLKANKKPLDLMVQGAARSRFFVPLVKRGASGSESLYDTLGVQIVTLSQVRTTARTLLARFYLSLADGRVDAAVRDLAAVHRWARLVDQHPLLNVGLLTPNIEQMATRADRVLANSKHLNAAQATAYRKQLAKIGPLAHLPDKFAFAERCFQLDGLIVMTRQKPADALADLLPDDAAGQLKKLVSKKNAPRLVKLIDWDAVARNVNRSYDRMAKIATMSELSKRRAQAQKFQAQLGTEEATGLRFLQALRSKKPDPGNVASTLSDILVHANVELLATMLDTKDRARVQFDLTQVAFALGAYRRDKGGYPEKLSALVPKYIPRLLPDRFTGQSFRYARERRGYVLYSLGVNRRDDEGVFESPEADDISVRMTR